MTSRARALTALGAYFCLAAQAVGLLHVLVVRHATCPSHGELVHGAAVATPRAADDTVQAPPAAGEDVDDHCLALANRRRDLAALTPVLEQLPAPEVHPRALPPAPAAALAALPLLRLAPKTSPPASV
jgi:hypothetical protein